MVAYSFKQRFAAPILAGTKCQTIRADRRRHARPGEEMQLYTGMRTKQCRLLARVKCSQVHPVTLSFLQGQVRIGRISYYDLDAFARRDGFEDWDDMRAFWHEEHGAPAEWEGVLVSWSPPP
jgi:hypothetical protein